MGWQCAYCNGQEYNICIECIKTYIAAGEDLNAQDEDGNTALHFLESMEIAQLLIEAGADPTILNARGESPRVLAGEPLSEVSSVSDSTASTASTASNASTTSNASDSTASTTSNASDSTASTDSTASNASTTSNASDSTATSNPPYRLNDQTGKLEIHGQPFTDYDVRKNGTYIRNPATKRFVLQEGLTGQLILKEALLSASRGQKGTQRYRMRTDTVLPRGTLVNISVTEPLPEGKDDLLDLLANVLAEHPDYRPEYLTPGEFETNLTVASRPYYTSVRTNRGVFNTLNRLYMNFEP